MDRPSKVFDYPYFGAKGADTERIHPTQKPIALYKWVLQNFAEKGDKILDTHVGSGSSLIACYDLGFDVWGYEIDKVYYDLAQKRIADFTAQTRIDLDALQGL